MGYLTTFGENIVTGAAKKTSFGLLGNPVFIASALAVSAGVSFFGVKALIESDFVQLPTASPTDAIVEHYEQSSQTTTNIAPPAVTTTAQTTTTAAPTEPSIIETTTTAATAPMSRRFARSYLTQSVNYPEVHIPGYTLPDEYGDGLLDPEAAFWLINQIRTSYGLEPFVHGGEQMKNAARVRMGEVMADFSQTRPDGSSYRSVFGECGIETEYCMESLGYGHYTAEHVVSEWIESEKNRANILSSECTVVYIMCEMDNENVPVWVLEAVTPDSIGGM